MFKLYKFENHWDVVKDHAETSFQHTCSPLPNFTVTATGLVLIREEKDLSQPETEFLNAQFACVGVTPRIIQHNFRNQFRDSRRTPSSTLVVRMRARHATSVLGVDGHILCFAATTQPWSWSPELLDQWWTWCLLGRGHILEIS